MVELDAVTAAWRALPPGDEAVLASVVHVEGSAYRRPGAHMLVTRDAARVGTISGGCLEADVVRRAWWHTATGRPVVRTYDTMSEGDARWEFGLGCQGIIQVLLERVSSPSTQEYLDFLAAHRAGRRAAVAATVIRTAASTTLAVGDRLLVDGAGLCGGALARTASCDTVRAAAVEALERGRSTLLHLGDADVFVEYVAPQPALVIIGAGDDAQPVSLLAQQLGWAVAVADGRPGYAVPERFPGAATTTLRSGEAAESLPIGPETFVVMMTHNYPFDAHMLPSVVAQSPRYLGVLGPRNRAEQLFADTGLSMPASVHAPVGLDLGGDTPVAVAMGIVAELQAVQHGRAGSMLRTRTGSIHAPVETRGTEDFCAPAPPSVPTVCALTAYVA